MIRVDNIYIHWNAQVKFYNILPRELMVYKVIIEDNITAEVHADCALIACLILIELEHTPVKVLNPKEHD